MTMFKEQELSWKKSETSIETEQKRDLEKLFEKKLGLSCAR